jgi:hypothetical protein
MMLDLDLERTTKAALPHGSREVGGGFILLRPREEAPHALWDCEAAALQEFFPSAQIGDQVCVRRWAKLRIPTGQNCYTAWKELEKPLEKRRTAHNIKVFPLSLFACMQIHPRC